MKIAIFFLLAFGVSILVNYLFSLALSRFARKKSGMSERLRLSSIEDASKVLRRKKTDFTKEEKMHLWSDAMNILMTAETEELAARYMERTAIALGDQGKDFRELGDQILKKRFQTKLQLQS